MRPGRRPVRPGPPARPAGGCPVCRRSRRLGRRRCGAATGGPRPPPPPRRRPGGDDAGLRRWLDRAARSLRPAAARPGPRARHGLRRPWVPRLAAARVLGDRDPRSRRGGRLSRRRDRRRAAGAGSTGAPTGRGGDARRDRVRGPRALLPRAVRRRAGRARWRCVRARGPGPLPGRLGNAAARHRVGPRRVDDAATLAGLPHARRRLDLGGPAPARRSRRPGLAAPPRRNRTRGRRRPVRGAVRRRRRRRPAGAGAVGATARATRHPWRRREAPPCAARSTGSAWA
jgi:hypothetical protein